VTPEDEGASVTVTTTRDGCAELTLTGDIDAGVLGELEARIDAPPLSDAEEWRVDMTRVHHLDLACAYALLRAVTQRTVPVSVTIHAAHRTVQRTLRHVGLDAVATIEG